MYFAVFTAVLLAGAASANEFAKITFVRRDQPSASVLTLQLSVPAKVNGARNLRVNGTVTNKGKRNVRLNPRWTVFDGVQSDLFSIVTRAPKYANPSPVFIGAIGWHGSTFETLPGWKSADGGPRVPIALDEEDYNALQARYGLYKTGGFVEIRPGQSTSFSVPLGQRYNFTELRGPFDIKLRNNTFRALSRKFDEYDHVIRYWDVVEAQTKPAVFDIVGDRAPAPYMVRTSDFVFDEGERYPDAWTSVLRAKNIKHQNVSCTEDQKSKILGPALMAYHGMKTTIKWMNHHDASDLTFQKWFGDPWRIKQNNNPSGSETDPATHYSTVLRRFHSMVATYKGMSFSCNCEDPTGSIYAQVAPDWPMIYVCPPWFKASPGPTPNGGPNQDGMIVHELTHFTFNGGTRDTIKNRELADYRPQLLELADKDPLEAVHEADSYRAFYNDIVTMMGTS